MGCHSQQKFTFSKFWELEVWDQDTNIVRFGRGSFSLLASGQILLVCLVKFPLVSLLLRTLFFCNIIAVVQSLSHVWLCNLMKYNMPGFPVLHYLQICSDSHPLSQWCHPTILPTVAYFSFCPRSFLVIKVFPNESALCIRWPKYWSFSFSISLSNDCSRLISFRIDFFWSPFYPRASQEFS